jgi:hypothetical protein
LASAEVIDAMNVLAPVEDISGLPSSAVVAKSFPGARLVPVVAGSRLAAFAPIAALLCAGRIQALGATEGCASPFVMSGYM